MILHGKLHVTAFTTFSLMIFSSKGATLRAAEYKSRPELESVRVGVGSGVCKLLRLWPGVAGYHSSTDDDFGRTVIHRLKNIKR